MRANPASALAFSRQRFSNGDYALTLPAPPVTTASPAAQVPATPAPPRRAARSGLFRCFITSLAACLLIITGAVYWTKVRRILESATLAADPVTTTADETDAPPPLIHDGPTVPVTRKRVLASRSAKVSDPPATVADSEPADSGADSTPGEGGEAAAAAATAPLGGDAAAAAAPLVLLSSDPAAVCLDGTPGGFYHRPAPPGGEPRKWVVVLGDGDGAPECADKAACRARGKSRFGTSKLMSPTLEGADPAPPPLVSPDCHSSPGFCAWHHVLLPYCSQDWWAGRASRPSRKTWGRSFAGHEILRAALDALVAAGAGGLGEASEVLLVGAGAGGHGVWANADFVASRLPSARVSALVLNAFHAQCHSGGGAGGGGAYGGSGRTAVSPAADLSCAALSQRSSLWNAHVDADCAAAQAAAGESPGACLLGGAAAPHVSARTFIAQALLDRAALEAHFGMPASVSSSTAGPGAAAFLSEWRAGLGAALHGVAAAPRGHGAFAPACEQRIGGGGGGPRVDGKDFQTALALWYAAPPPSSKRGARAAAKQHTHVDSCGGGAGGGALACNPSCGGGAG